MTRRHLQGWHRRLERQLRPYGLRLEPHRGHVRVLDASGRVVAQVAGTPKDRHAAIAATLHELRRRGLLPRAPP